MTKIIKALGGPKYDGKYLQQIVKEKLGNTKLHQALTNIVIPTFDIKQLQPTIFSTYEVLLFVHLSIKSYINNMLSMIIINIYKYIINEISFVSTVKERSFN